MGISIGGNKGSSSSTSTSESWLVDKLGPLIDQAIAGQGDVPLQEFIGMNKDQLAALEGIMGGRDWTGLQQGAGVLGQIGMGQLQGGGQFLQDAMNQYKDVMGQLSGGGFQDLVQSGYNSDLVQQQLDVMGQGVQGALDKNIQAINQRASGSGNMGSSRAGVAEGVAIGEASQAMASGAAQIQGNAWNQALASANQQASNMLSGATSGMNFGNTLLGQGVQGLTGSMQLGQTIMGGQQQDLFNKFGAGSIIQQQGQAQADIDRINQMISSNQALAQLGMLLPVIGGTAGWQGTNVGSGTTSGSNWGMSAQFPGTGGKSDRRLKDELEVVREASTVEIEEGVVYHLPRLYKWKWNDIAMALFEAEGYESIPPEYGVIAQELEEMGLEYLVHKFLTEVEGLDGEYRVVNYAGLLDYSKAVTERLGYKPE